MQTEAVPERFDRDRVRGQVEYLAARGVFVGTSSWRYPGWRGLLYTDDRYVGRGGFSAQRFHRYCLREYAEVFKTVCVDAAYYRFPERAQLEEMVGMVPEDFRFVLKVTDAITIKTFPQLPKFGQLAGKPNPDFLNAELFVSEFLGVCAPFRPKIAALVFEFSRFHQSDFSRGREFVDALDAFLGKLPRDWDYAVEIRNPTFLHPDYFAMLARHNAGHVFNSWTDMPPVQDQFVGYCSWVRPDLILARFLLRPGRKYEDAVRLFSPYRTVKDPFPEGRRAAEQVINYCLEPGANRRAFVFVNNRFEGNALFTIAAILDKVCAQPGHGCPDVPPNTAGLDLLGQGPVAA